MTNRKQPEDMTGFYEKWEVEKLVGFEVDKAIGAHTMAMKEYIEDRFTMKLGKLLMGYAVGRWIVAAVGMLLLGTIWQAFIAVSGAVGK